MSRHDNDSEEEEESPRSNSQIKNKKIKNDINRTEHESSDADSKTTYCDEITQRLIKKCWMQQPQSRPKFFEICQLLQNKIKWRGLEEFGKRHANEEVK